MPLCPECHRATRRAGKPHWSKELPSQANHPIAYVMWMGYNMVVDLSPVDYDLNPSGPKRFRWVVYGPHHLRLGSGISRDVLQAEKNAERLARFHYHETQGHKTIRGFR